jgi:hypothetical protein
VRLHLYCCNRIFVVLRPTLFELVLFHCQIKVMLPDGIRHVICSLHSTPYTLQTCILLRCCRQVIESAHGPSGRVWTVILQFLSGHRWARVKGFSCRVLHGPTRWMFDDCRFNSTGTWTVEKTQLFNMKRSPHAAELRLQGQLKRHNCSTWNGLHRRLS